MDGRGLYIAQLLNNYRQPFPLPQSYYTVNYHFSNAQHDCYRVFGHNEGIDLAVEYIRELERG